MGLGNPGAKYEKSRHNIGFRIIEAIAIVRAATSFRKIAAIAEVSTFGLDQIKVILAKPLTFMNLSGQAVRFLMDFYKISSEKIYVFHDDIDLKFGDIKIKKSGGNGGHNGLRSIDALVGNNYWRVRIGVGRPKEKSMVSSYVLDDFSQDEKNIMQNVCFKISENMALLFCDSKKLEFELNKGA